MLKALELRLEAVGARLSWRQRLVNTLWGPLFFDWSATLFTAGYALVLLFLTPLGPSMGVFRGPMVPAFAPWVIVYASCMLIAGIVGLLGLAHRHRGLRMSSSYLLVLAYLLLAIYYVRAIPLPWPAVYVYTFHAALEALVYVRTATDPHHAWH